MAYVEIAVKKNSGARLVVFIYYLHIIPIDFTWAYFYRL